MPQRSEYRVIPGGPRKIEHDIAPLAAEGFKPILITSSTGGTNIIVVVVMEHVLGS